MGDRIEVRGIEVNARHGVYAQEQADGQLFVIDIALTADLAQAGASDDLADTIDYGAIAVTVHDVVASERWDLIERVATRVCETVLEIDRRIETVTVTVHKPHAPIPLAFSDVFLTLERSR